MREIKGQLYNNYEQVIKNHILLDFFVSQFRSSLNKVGFVHRYLTDLVYTTYTAHTVVRRVECLHTWNKFSTAKT